jgi:hypothetical protein
MIGSTGSTRVVAGYLLKLFLGWGDTEPTRYYRHFRLLYQPQMVNDECGAVGGMRICRGNGKLKVK